jgi:hypothetical protein
MKWPQISDYQDAVQNPDICFVDGELKRGIVELDAKGLPCAGSGSFNVVYTIKSGSRKWAVRCFTKKITDQKIRYHAISKHLQQNKLPFLVHFSYLDKGIRVKDDWFPILKMEWVDGEPLLKYIERHLKNPSKLANLAEKWVLMNQQLKQSQIAHGDLQHGNIYMVNHDFKLIDYDGMYVPSLKGKTSNELGHPNYQHPRRDNNHFGPYLDHFSAWNIYLSLVALAVEPRLHRYVSSKNEHILFHKDHLLHPNLNDPILSLLRNIPNPDIAKQIDVFLGYCSLDVTNVPPLDTHFMNQTISINTGLSAERSISEKAGSWLDDHLTDEDNEHVSWLSDYIDGYDLSNSVDDTFIENDSNSSGTKSIKGQCIKGQCIKGQSIKGNLVIGVFMVVFLIFVLYFSVRH